MFRCSNIAPLATPVVPPEQRHKAAIEADPANVEHYFRLADLYLHEQRLDEAQKVLERAGEAAGGGNLQVRERLLDQFSRELQRPTRELSR